MPIKAEHCKLNTADTYKKIDSCIDDLNTLVSNLELGPCTDEEYTIVEELFENLDSVRDELSSKKDELENTPVEEEEEVDEEDEGDPDDKVKPNEV